MVENIPELRKETDIKLQEAQRDLNKFKEMHRERESINKLSKVKDKDRILKATGERKLVTKGDPHKTI